MVAAEASKGINASAWPISQALAFMHQSTNYMTPTIGIFYTAPLDTGQLVVELLAKRADLVVVDLVLVVVPRKLADGGDDSGRADAPSLLKRAVLRGLEELIDTEKPLLDRNAPALEPRRIEPVSIGVTTVPLILNMTFMPPPSSTYLRSTPSSHSTCE